MDDVPIEAMREEAMAACLRRAFGPPPAEDCPGAFRDLLDRLRVAPEPDAAPERPRREA
jgi:hypothetical protein